MKLIFLTQLTLAQICVYKLAMWSEVAAIVSADPWMHINMSCNLFNQRLKK